MAEKEHLNILNHGADIWNDWREEEFYIAPDLSDADLRGIKVKEMYLSGANLSRVNLSGEDLSDARLSDTNLTEAKLNGANLSKAHLTSANLFRADLIGANLSQADLQAADFRDADLRDANLSETYLGGAIFTGANLHHVKLNGASINGTTFGENDLSVVEGLETINHAGASIIGIDTLYRSNGKIPTNFLRGCGIPDNFISYIPSLFGETVQFNSCFISYSSKDTEIVTNIYRDLQNAGVRCWLAPQNLKPGDNISSAIDEAIRVYDKLLLVLSSAAVESKWVQIEVNKALEKEQDTEKSILFPVQLDDSVMESNYEWAIRLREFKHIGDFRNWENPSAYQRALSRLIRDLKLSIAIESDKSGEMVTV
jgi:hypothetical protein